MGDTAFVPTLSAPAFGPGEGPRVVLDEAHHNFHTLNGRYAPFARVLRADGFVVDPGTRTFDAGSLAGVDLLVVANALHERNALGEWELPTPSAFTDAEIEAVRRWVEGGGALLLVADHMPFPGAAAELAAAFGFEFNNGFAMDTTAAGPLIFRRSDGSLRPHPVVSGGTPDERVDSVATFTGQAFRAPASAASLLVVPEGIVSLMPEVAWEFDEATPRVDVSGWSQGAVRDYGRGRVAVFGEAAMFTAQRTGAAGGTMGMNAPPAGRNAQFLVNLVRWLTTPGR